jgi:hypothetical protein
LKTFRLTLVERDGEPDSSSTVVPTVRFGSGHPLDGRLASDDERRHLTLDPAVLRRSVQRHRQRRRADERPQPEPVPGVVDELEIRVRVVDRRITALRVVADVERVVRPSVIGRPASYAALNVVVETWHTPPPRPVLSSPLMITGASRKPFDSERSPWWR